MKNRFSLHVTLLTLALSSPLALAEERSHPPNHTHPQTETETETGKAPSGQEEAMKVDIRKYMQKMQDTMIHMHNSPIRFRKLNILKS